MKLERMVWPALVGVVFSLSKRSINSWKAVSLSAADDSCVIFRYKPVKVFVGPLGTLREIIFFVIKTNPNYKFTQNF